MNGYGRSGQGDGPNGRPSPDPRRGLSPGLPNGASSMSINRAERFEDEKRRLMDSCFSKMDPNGQIAESYITHIRVQEDGAYPQSPPPPESPPSNKKPRVIIVAVKNTGRVRMHKARENSNGSFSIGKSWGLEELSTLQSYSHINPQTPEEKDHKQWAGDVGFLVTMTKPYYWQAGTAKEKEFFIASVVKIFRKYTQGKVPELLGFSPVEIDAMLGGVGAQQGNRQASQTRPGQRPPGSSGGSPGRQPPVRASPDLSNTQNQQAPPRRVRPPPSGHDERSPRIPPEPSQMSPPLAPGRDPTRQPRPRQLQEQAMRPSPSQDQLGRSPIPPQLLAAQRLTPQSSRSDLEPQRSITPESMSSTPSIPPRGSPDARKGRPNDSSENLNGGLGGRFRKDASPDSQRPSTAQSGSSIPPPRNEDRLEPRPLNGLPERRRPTISGPMSNDSISSNREHSTEKTSTTTESPGPPPRRRGINETASGASQETIEPEKVPAPENGSYFPAMDSQRNDTSKSTASELERLPTSASGSKEDQQDLASPPLASPNSMKSPTDEKNESVRPGLGPMVKKKTAGDILRKAAQTYGAFKPRAGGAADRFAPKTASNEPDGITGVVPAPSMKSPTPSAVTTPIDSPTVETPKQYEKPEPPKPSVSTDAVPQLTVSSPQSPGPRPEMTLPLQPQVVPEPSPSPEKKKPEPEKKKRRRSMQQVRYLDNLGVDASLLEGRGLDFEQTLTDFGWGNSAVQTKKIELIEADIRRELGRVEAGSWLGHLEQKDDRVETVEKLLDKAIAECEEMEGLLTLYSVELSSLNDDIAYIEAQGQGLQVQTANQKLLQTELQQLVDTLSITPGQLEALRRAQLGKTEGLEAVESALLLLYRAMRTIDPSLRHDSPMSDAIDSNKRHSAFGINEMGNMRALIEKRESYEDESTIFLERLKQFLDMTFGAALLETMDEIKRLNSDHAKINTKLDIGAHDRARVGLWQYSPLLLFAKEVDRAAWDVLVKLYRQRAGPVYQEEMRDNNSAWRKKARKPTGEEQDLLFTTPQEKENESLSTTARKLTVKRSQTLAKGLRSSHHDRNIDKQSDKLWPYQSFSGALDEMAPLIFTEQNFIVDFFHATAAENADFAEIVSTIPLEARRGTNLYERKPFEPDRDMAKRVMDVMDDIFSFWATDMQSLMEWAVKIDPLQGVGILYAVQRKLAEYEETNQDFLTRTLQKLNERLSGLFQRFVDDQIRAIEDTKVKIKKRKGVIAFMKTFPPFSMAIENMVPAYDEHDRLEVRTMVDDAYGKVNKAMFESLKVIAKDSPAVMAVQGQGDPEDKEALNYHILHIENMNHYIEEVDERGDPVLMEWRGKAMKEMDEHMSLYVDAVVRRPLGKLIEFIESTEAMLVALPSGTPPTSIADRASHGKHIFKKVIAQFDAKEVRKGVDALRKRLEKHFGDADEPGLSRNLVQKVSKQCEAKYIDVHERAAEVRRIVYDSETGLEFSRADVESWFRR
ncbi:hypothetical protein EJ05DRAFT_514463 [Pseudovirgaria hyperparasitica]|uniref:Exocyst complex component Sec3 PIP2-binding N-terminal domain-containing protein n=1 Tax=Pseudovirgaria hyperparasitica TaxID=470096 RepID=A0A6A6VTG5_9PEZI|nr:uncharacterized protein EJ05DRAFT_514463 [Pseudovirgaria hyperparasitica]KAF2753978.1 hypothetical protein EJ05DRAFT_514463 [Pseudovirgaria hyperparasitica]